MKAICQNLFGTTTEWERENPILWEGVIGVEVKNDEGDLLIKVGDGKNPFSNLKSIDLKLLKELDERLSSLERKIRQLTGEGE
jgi:hypothetical protein